MLEPLLPFERGSVFFDATLGAVRLKHPEGLAVASDGAVWCGGDGGEIYRIEPDGSSIEVIGSTGGFTLGMAFDVKGRLYTCDLAHKAIWRLDPGTRKLEQFSTGGDGGSMRVPNYPVVDSGRNCLYVSDSFAFGTPGPGVWRLDLMTGDGTLWYDRPLNFANGMALTPDRQTLYVVETFARQVSRIPILEDGSAGEAEVFVDGIERLPDGLAFDAAGNLYIACYEPSRLYRATPDGKLELLYDDPDAHMLCHPTNCAFRGGDLFTSNLGRWHITKIEVGSAGSPLLELIRDPMAES
jgi:sugar lactone lactonase YvrE